MKIIMIKCEGGEFAEFAGTDHRLLVATLKIRFKSRKMASSNQVWLDVCNLRDESVSQEYKRELGLYSCLHASWLR